MSFASPIDATGKAQEIHDVDSEPMDVAGSVAALPVEPPYHCHLCTIRVFEETGDGDGDSEPRIEIDPALPSSSSSAADGTLLRISHMEVSVRNVTLAHSMRC